MVEPPPGMRVEEIGLGALLADQRLRLARVGGTGDAVGLGLIGRVTHAIQSRTSVAISSATSASGRIPSMTRQRSGASRASAR